MSAHQKKVALKENTQRRQKLSGKDGIGGLWLYGYHAVAAALQNPRRKIYRLLLSKETARELPQNLIPEDTGYEPADRADFDQILP